MHEYVELLELLRGGSEGGSAIHTGEVVSVEPMVIAVAGTEIDGEIFAPPQLLDCRAYESEELSAYAAAGRLKAGDSVLLCIADSVTYVIGKVVEAA